MLDNGRQKEIITLDDSAQTARRGRTNVVPTRVISIGGGATTGNIPVTVVAGGTGVSQTPPASTARTASPRTNTTVRNNVITVPGIQAGGQQVNSTPQGNNQQQGNTNTVSPTTQTPVPTPGAVQRNPRAVRTPWGDIIRPDP